ncbi:MAG: serine protease MucD [Bdellovibrionales bacterium RIFCSPHIGHO2_01_FULL_40_29]|nr:MAG: serine protease MucD [Bdellovibrionales bacterium RIFCSPHIGHO2_01_FULL_40_29]OFZ32503.1 MAG: serine protease MucD [Bdellovibrionales bacterium RIFCSPHIGHO2_02_FULL_40_15]
MPTTTNTASNLTKTLPTLKLSDPLPANLFVELAKAVNPAVVNISTSVIPQGRQGYQRDPMLEMLEQFYGRKMAPDFTPGKPQRMGLGTGFIIREDGLIITNNHVIQGADLIEVQVSEGDSKPYKATVIGSDLRTDIALIKIVPKEKLVVASLGSSADVEVGEWVAAFGNPYGHGHSMTKGIISSKGRAIEEINKIPLLQTDASINPGNSGGPLVNSKGQVIGVNSAIDARAQGIGFAIPIDEVKTIIPQLEQRGSIRKGFLGINPGDLDDQAASYLGLDEHRGSVVMGIGDGPGRKGGLKIYDVITEVDGKKIKHSTDLVDTISDIEPGKKVKLKIIRNEKPQTLTVTIGERPSERPTQVAYTEPKKYSGQKAPFNLGFVVADLTDDIRKEWKITAEVNKPIVIETERNSAASRQGIRTGDLILEINKTEIKSAKDVLKNLKKGTNTLKVARPSGVSMLEVEVR